MVSIVVPVYNVGQYLEKCISSLIMQDYEDIEIILVDDGSTDESGEICEQYSNKYGNIITIHQKNMGLSSARNTGTKNANGQYIAYVDSDDWVSNDYISYQINLAEIYHADIVAVKQVSVWGEMESSIRNEKECIEVFTAKEAVKEMCYGYKFGASACKLIKQEIAYKYEFPVGELYEDLAVMYKMLAASNCVVYSNLGKYYYRRRATSIINQKFNPKHLCILKHSEKLRDFIIDYSPELYTAAIYKSAYVITQIMPMVIYSKERNVFFSLREEMKGYFPIVLKDKRVKIKYKVRCFAILCGYWFAKAEIRTEEKIKNMLGKSL